MKLEGELGRKLSLAKGMTGLRRQKGGMALPFFFMY